MYLSMRALRSLPCTWSRLARGCRIVIHEPLGQSLANGLSNPPYQRFVLTPTSERVTMFLLRCARPFLRHWAERGSLPLKVGAESYLIRSLASFVPKHSFIYSLVVRPPCPSCRAVSAGTMRRIITYRIAPEIKCTGVSQGNRE